MRTIIILAVFTSFPLFAQTPDLSGTWVADSNSSQKWVLTQKDNQIHVQKMNGDKVETNFTCSLAGLECKAKENGRSEKITMYFNGSKLVEIEERGDETIKSRMAVSSDGKILTIETVPLSTNQRTEVASFRRQDS
jgi:uncharacterized protein YycO